MVDRSADIPQGVSNPYYVRSMLVSTIIEQAVDLEYQPIPLVPSFTTNPYCLFERPMLKPLTELFATSVYAIEQYSY